MSRYTGGLAIGPRAVVAGGGGVAIGGSASGTIIVTGQGNEVGFSRAFPYESVIRIEKNSGEMVCLGFLCESPKGIVGVVPFVPKEKWGVCFPFISQHLYSATVVYTHVERAVTIISLRDMPSDSLPVSMGQHQRTYFPVRLVGYPDGKACQFVVTLAEDKGDRIVLDTESVGLKPKEWQYFIGGPVWGVREKAVVGRIGRIKGESVLIDSVPDILMAAGIW